MAAADEDTVSDEAEATSGETGDAAASPSSPEPVELPQRFFCGFRLGLVVGGATLVVDEGSLRLYPDGSLQEHDGADPVEHVDAAVKLFTPTWQPPTSNTGLLLEDDRSERIALADLPGWQRERLRAALAAAGFEVDETKGGFDIGRKHVRPSASPWPRWFQKLWTKGDVPPRR